MTDQEFEKWSKRLFVAFPSLWSWLQDNSPSPKETQAIWRETLRPYTFIECLQVVADWSDGTLKMIEAYERDKVHLHVAAIVGLRRDREHRRRKTAEDQDAYRNARRGPLDITRRLDGDMRKAFERLRPEHRKMLDGDITPGDYELAKSKVLAEL